MTNNFPYQKEFNDYLRKNDLVEITIDEYDIIISDLFQYLSNFNLGYQRDHRVSQLFDRDIQDYLEMLVNKRKIADLTYNKVLSHINIYFKFLFQQGWNRNMPTLGLKGKGKAELKKTSTKWLDLMPQLLVNDQLHFYTRMTLLLISHGYSEKEFLLPNFKRVLKDESWQPFEKNFLKQFYDFIRPFQTKQNCSDLFIKQRFSKDPHITLPGLHKYLRPDQKIAGFSLSPSRLFQSYMLKFIANHSEMSVPELANRLKTRPASILYYQNIIDQHEIN